MIAQKRSSTITNVMLGNLMAIPYRHLCDTIRKSWSKDSSLTPKFWDINHPEVGQDLITALVIQDFLGGDILGIKTISSTIYINYIGNLAIVGLDSAHTFQDRYGILPSFHIYRDQMLKNSTIMIRFKRLLTEVLTRLQGA